MLTIARQGRSLLSKLFIIIATLSVFSASNVYPFSKNMEIFDEKAKFLENILNFEHQFTENQTINLPKEANILEEILIAKIKKEIHMLRLKDIIKDNAQFQSFSIPLAKYFLKFSSFAYCNKNDMLSQKCCPEIFTDDQWELVAEKTVSYDDYNYAILVSNKYKKILVTFPGTRGPSQLVKELYYSNGVIFNNDPTEKVMYYIKNVYALFKEDLEKTLEGLFVKFKNYQFIFTGHSLGGSMAGLSVIHSIKYGGLKPTKNSPMLITYGQPRIGNDVFANELMKYVPIVYRITRYGDIVTNIPPCYNFFVDKYQIKCQGILPEYKFNKDLVLDERQTKASQTNFYNWHTAGWKHFNDAMVEYEDCGNEYGENFSNPKCQLGLSLDISKHIVYFGLKVSEICAPK